MSAPPIVILNPFARSERAAIRVDELKRVASRCMIKPTSGPGSAKAIAEEVVRAGGAIVVAAGGDGTINEVVNGIIGKNAALGIIPMGTVNVLARELGIPLDVRGAWEVIERGHAKSLDLVRVDFELDGRSQTRHAVQLAGIGLDAHIVKRVTWGEKKRWGPWSYVFQAFRSLAQSHSRVMIRMEEEGPLEGAFLLVGNGALYGGPFSVFNKASMTDGLMDLCLFQSSGLANLLIYLVAIACGIQSKTRGIFYRQSRSFEVISRGSVPIQIDGEFAGCLPAKFTVIPAALKVLVPSSTV